MRRAPHGLGVMIVGSIEIDAGAFEAGMHDLAAHRLRRDRHAVLAVAHHHRDLAEAALGVKAERGLALGGEEEIVGEKHSYSAGLSAARRSDGNGGKASAIAAAPKPMALEAI